MSDLNRINRGFEAMLPKARKEEEKKYCNHHFSFVIFGKKISFNFQVTQPNRE